MLIGSHSIPPEQAATTTSSLIEPHRQHIIHKHRRNNVTESLIACVWWAIKHLRLRWIDSSRDGERGAPKITQYESSRQQIAWMRQSHPHATAARRSSTNHRLQLFSNSQSNCGAVCAPPCYRCFLRASKIKSTAHVERASNEFLTAARASSCVGLIPCVLPRPNLIIRCGGVRGKKVFTCRCGCRLHHTRQCMYTPWRCSLAQKRPWAACSGGGRGSFSLLLRTLFEKRQNHRHARIYNSTT
jgi:hypothetical protein